MGIKAIILAMTGLVALSLACNDEKEIIDDNSNELLSSSEIVIKDGVITHPKWLVKAVDSVAHSHVAGEGYIYPNVFSLIGEGKEYILIFDGLNSNASEGNMLFSLSGTLIKDYPNKLIETDNLNLIWPILNTKTK